MPGQVHNSLRRVTNLQRAYKVLLNEDDPRFTGIERAGETLTPTLDLFTPDEYKALRSVRRQASTQVVAAVAAEFGIVHITNTAPDRLVVIRDLWFYSTSAATFRFGQVATSGANTGQVNQRLDTRWSATDAATVAMLGDTNVAAVLGAGWIERCVVASDPRHLNKTIVLAPLTSYSAECQTANLQVVVGIEYEIFPANEAEVATV